MKHLMKHGQSWITALAVVVITGLPGVVAGQEQDKDAAKRHFKAGQALLKMERFAEAITEFKKAFEITQDKLVMGQVAVAFEQAGDYEAALESIKIYSTSEKLSEDDRKSVAAMIKKYEKLVADGKSKKLVMPIESKPEPTEEEGKAPMPDPEPEEAPTKRFYTWIAAGAAGALALSALVVGLNAQSKYDELAGTCKPGCPQSDVDSVKTRALVADILWGTAAAAAVTAGVLYFIEGKRIKTEEERQPGEGEDEEDFVKRFQIAPVVGGGTYGLGANLRF